MYRPKQLKEFIGQTKVIAQVEIMAIAARKRNLPLPHILLTGPSGTGKTTLARILSGMLGQRFSMTTPAAIQKNSDLFQMFSETMEEGKAVCIFIDEVHRLSTVSQEDLYLPMENREFIKKGQVNTKYEMDPWTLIAATTAPGDLEEAFRNRFGVILSMEPYTIKDMVGILQQAAVKNKIVAEEHALIQVAIRSRNNPRIANHLLDRCNDYATAADETRISKATCLAAFEAMGIDEKGLTDVDRKYLAALYNADRAIGLRSLIPILHTDVETISTSIEPYLVEEGYMLLTSRGRQLTQKGVRYVEKNSPRNKNIKEG